MSESKWAVRHPKRGKAHRRVNARPSQWGTRRYPATTGCGAPLSPLTERIEVARTDPSDRCKKCWPDTPTTPRAGSGRGETSSTEEEK